VTRPDSQIDIDGVRRFWEERARRFQDQDPVNLSNLEADPALAQQKHSQERRVLEDYVQARPQDVMLDLGAGHGAWAANFATRVAHIDCVEYSSGMAEIAQANFARLGIGNVEVFCTPAQDFVAERAYDVILASGILIYLTDEQLAQLLTHMRGYAKPGSRVILRDGTAKESHFTIRNKYSSELDAMYSADYRTAEEYIRWFAQFGFEIVRHQDMFPAGSPLNKRRETILRIYEFRSPAQ
jgi:cyclopropane fatty-acyl-phospholipid synthase-like methyltransferase